MIWLPALLCFLLLRPECFVPVSHYLQSLCVFSCLLCFKLHVVHTLDRTLSGVCDFQQCSEVSNPTSSLTLMNVRFTFLCEPNFFGPSHSAMWSRWRHLKVTFARTQNVTNADLDARCYRPKAQDPLSLNYNYPSRFSNNQNY